MRTERMSGLGLAVLVVALVVAGIVTVGGPGTGRMETRDETRLEDLRALNGFVHCVADTRKRTLPESLQPIDTCRGEYRFHDPFTEEPYRYEKVSDTAYILCAGFEDPGWVNDMRLANVDPETGCIQFTYVFPS